MQKPVLIKVRSYENLYLSNYIQIVGIYPNQILHFFKKTAYQSDVEYAMRIKIPINTTHKYVNMLKSILSYLFTLINSEYRS